MSDFVERDAVASRDLLRTDDPAGLRWHKGIVQDAFKKCVDALMAAASYNDAVQCAAIKYTECAGDESTEDGAWVALENAIEAARDQAIETKLMLCMGAVHTGAHLLKQIDGRLSADRDEWDVVTDEDVDGFISRRDKLPPPPPFVSCHILPSNVTPFQSLAQAPMPPRWLVRDVLEDRGFSLLIAASNSGKSAAALDVAMCVAAGQSWRGRDTKQGAVIFNAAEAADSLKDRARAWGLRNGVKDAPLFVDDRAYDLTDKPEADDFIANARMAQIDAGRSIALVAIDTLAASFGAKDENPGGPMQAFIQSVYRIRDALGAAVLVLHHPNAAGDPRGHSSLKGAADTILRIEASCIVDTKQRSGVKGTRFPFRIAGFEIGQDAAGRPVTAAVIDHIMDAKAAAPAAKTLDPLPLLVDAIWAADNEGKPLRLNKPHGLHERRASLPAPLSKMGRDPLQKLAKDGIAAGLIVNRAGTLSAASALP